MSKVKYGYNNAHEKAKLRRNLRRKEGIHKKQRQIWLHLIRHPHVFNDLDLTEEEMHKLWDNIKKKEKEGKPNLDNYLKDAFNESKDLIDKAINRKGF